MAFTKQELQDKALPELRGMIRIARVDLVVARTRAAGTDLKDVRTVRELRQQLAQLLTRERQLMNTTS